MGDTDSMKLPPGQRAIETFPRFGLSQYAKRFPKTTGQPQLRVGGDVETPFDAGEALATLPHIEQVSDFHCVTTWTKCGLRWGGVRFRDFYEQVVLTQARPHPGATLVVFRCGDGYRAGQTLEDLLMNDVLLADRLNGGPLSLEHGAPLRLVAPGLYGYKNPKHVKAVEFWMDDRNYRPPGFKFMAHERSRVALEERGRGLPGWIFRYLYRPLIGPTVKQFQRAMEQHEAGEGD